MVWTGGACVCETRPDINSREQRERPSKPDLHRASVSCSEGCDAETSERLLRSTVATENCLSPCGSQQAEQEKSERRVTVQSLSLHPHPE